MRIPSGIIVVLGEALRLNTTTNSYFASPSLLSRVATAARVYREKEMPLLCSGGDAVKCGRTEASVMREILQDILKERSDLDIRVEEDSRNTVENALYCRRKMQADFGGEVPENLCIHLCTSEYHMERAGLIFDTVFQEDNVKFIKHCADSLHRKGDMSYRKCEDRESDPGQWLLCERLDWERNAIQTLNDYISTRYGLKKIDQDKIENALANLSRFNETLQKG